MAPSRQKKIREIDQYSYQGQDRVNNPLVGLVTPKTDPDTGSKKTYAYDPHLDPQLVWAGKAEHTSFEVPTVSLHVHERIEPRTIVEAIRRREADGEPRQLSFFETPKENPPLRQAIEFYKHRHNWSNRLVAGDSLLVMSSLLEKEGMAGQVQMIYIDPPYGIKYGSNFQPFVNKRDVRDGKDEDLTAEPEQIRAFRDTWELGIHSYLTYLRNRLLLARELLTESGSVFVQISDENVHHVRELMDEVFGARNFVTLVPFRKRSMAFTTNTLPTMCDFVVWYCHDSSKVKFRSLFTERGISDDPEFAFIDDPSAQNGLRRLRPDERAQEGLLQSAKDRVFKRLDLCASGYGVTSDFPVSLGGQTYSPRRGVSWKTNASGVQRLLETRRLFGLLGSLYYKIYFNDFPFQRLTNIWTDTRGEVDKTYVVQTSELVVARCLLMTTDPGDLVVDPTCGSGTTAYVAEQWGRRWITCDTSRVALTLAKQRLMTAVYDYYEMAHPEEGVASGFVYRTAPHITLGSIANNPDIREGMSREDIDAAIARHAPQETLYDQPLRDRKKVRVTGPFTVEAVPSPAVRPISEFLQPDSDVATNDQPADQSIARSGETLRQREWRDELLKTGIRGKGGQRIEFARVEPLSGTRHLHAEAETKGDPPARVAVSFGPEHAPLEPRQVAMAIEEAQAMVPHPGLVVFAAFQFDPEAAKDIDEINWPGVKLLKAQMNTDLLTDDLKKKRASNDSFWLMGQPDAELHRIASGDHKGKWQVEVRGFDYFDTRTGELVSGGTANIAMWLLDTDYDGRSLYPRQVFFPIAAEKDGWARLARSLRAEIDEELAEAYRGTISLPFELGKWQRVAVKMVDDRGIESLKVIEAP